MSSWLEELKPGDDVAVQYYCGCGAPDPEQLRRVAKVTALWIVTECGEKYHRSNGAKTGVRRPARQHITRKWLDLLEQRERNSLRNQIWAYMEHGGRNVTTDQLRRICAILDEKQEQPNGT